MFDGFYNTTLLLFLILRNNLKNFAHLRTFMREFVLVFAVLLLITFSSAETNQATCSLGCTSISEYNNLSVTLSDKRDRIEELENLTSELNTSKNRYEELYREYRGLYLSDSANITNRELLRVHQNLTLIQNDLRDYSREINNVQKDVNNLRLEIAFGLISIAIIDIAARFMFGRSNRRKNQADAREDESNNFEN